MAQATHPLWPRLGVTTSWHTLLGDGIRKFGTRSDKILMIRSMLDFYFNTSIIYYNTSWWLFTDNSTRDANHVYYLYKQLFYTAGVYSNLLGTTSYYLLRQTNKFILTTNIYVVVINGVCFINYFQYRLRRKLKRMNIKLNEIFKKYNLIPKLSHYSLKMNLVWWST